MAWLPSSTSCEIARREKVATRPTHALPIATGGGKRTARPRRRRTDRVIVARRVAVRGPDAERACSVARRDRGRRAWTYGSRSRGSRRRCGGSSSGAFVYLRKVVAARYAAYQSRFERE